MSPFSAGIGRRDPYPELASLGLTGHTPGRVLTAHTERWLVASLAEDGQVSAPRLVSSRGRVRDRTDGGPPVTGDWVALDEGDAIAAVLDRHGEVVRRAAGPTTAPQVLAANVDLAFVVEPGTDANERRAERFAALATGGGVPTVLVLTKADLEPDTQAAATAMARRLGLTEAIAVSSRDGDGEGIAALRTLLLPGATTVLLGASGAGKSTLANALLGEDRQATGTVRDDGRGRHTTVTRELLPLPGGALLVDTPGLREVGLWDGPGDAFADIAALAQDCRFRDCAHGPGDPGCAVWGHVDRDRLAAWRTLGEEQSSLAGRRGRR